MRDPQETPKPCVGKQNTETGHYGEVAARTIERDRKERETFKIKKKRNGGKQRVNHISEQRVAVIRLNTCCTRTE